MTEATVDDWKNRELLAETLAGLATVIADELDSLHQTVGKPNAGLTNRERRQANRDVNKSVAIYGAAERVLADLFFAKKF